MALKMVPFLILSLIPIMIAGPTEPEKPNKEKKYKVCSFPSQADICHKMNASVVSCEEVLSSLECAQKMKDGKADIGVFNPEEILLFESELKNFKVWAGLYDEGKSEKYAFEGVAVVPNNLTLSNGFESLRGGKYCHPGLDDKDWTPRVLKALEQKIFNSTDKCPSSISEDVSELSKFFEAACIPGNWSHDSNIDAELKNKYKKLCSLCGDDATKATCDKYTIKMNDQMPEELKSNTHGQALECLVKHKENRTVAFVSWDTVSKYFSSNQQLQNSFSLLCPDATLIQLSSNNIAAPDAPCSLVKQPLRAIVSKGELSEYLKSSLTNGANPVGDTWQSMLYKLLVGDKKKVKIQDKITIEEYMSVRALKPLDSLNCSSSRWCTTSDQENAKCIWTQRAAHALGKPGVSCQQTSSVMDCMKDVSNSKADFTFVNTNYGYLARAKYNLEGVKIYNPENKIVKLAAIIKEEDAITIKSFNDTNEHGACFPDFGGLAYMSFVDFARKLNTTTDCDEAFTGASIFRGACAPGARDSERALSKDKPADLIRSFHKSLCSECKPESKCLAEINNQYFGDNGAAICLQQQGNKIAFVDINNIKVDDANKFRVLCRNNHLANVTGFEVPNECLLATAYDAELMTKKNNSQALDNYLNIIYQEEIPIDYSRSVFGVDSRCFIDPKDKTSEPVKSYTNLIEELKICKISPPIPTTSAPKPTTAKTTSTFNTSDYTVPGFNVTGNIINSTSSRKVAGAATNTVSSLLSTVFVSVVALTIGVCV